MKIVSRLFSKMKIVSRLFSKIVLTPLTPPTCHRPIACILQCFLQLRRQFWRQFWRQISLMGDTSAIIFQNENCPAMIFSSDHQGLLGHWGRRQFWATILETILIINWVATVVLSGPRLGSVALVRCRLSALAPPLQSGSCRAWQDMANTSLNKSFLR